MSSLTFNYPVHVHPSDTLSIKEKLGWLYDYAKLINVKPCAYGYYSGESVLEFEVTINDVSRLQKRKLRELVVKEDGDFYDDYFAVIKQWLNANVVLTVDVDMHTWYYGIDITIPNVTVDTYANRIKITISDATVDQLLSCASSPVREIREASYKVLPDAIYTDWFSKQLVEYLEHANNSVYRIVLRHMWRCLDEEDKNALFDCIKDLILLNVLPASLRSRTCVTMENTSFEVLLDTMIDPMVTHATHEVMRYSIPAFIKSLPRHNH